MSRYDFQVIEQERQRLWRERGEFRCPSDAARPYYALGMFPYPSGEPHMGHVRVYTITDVMARYKRLRGLSVMNPIGWDAFGLPAENAAIKTGQLPRVSTQNNIARMKEQLATLGWSFDWERDIDTSAPDYYRWTQWIFLRLLEHGIAYKAKGLVNWCPKDETVLANEQVIDGLCWRCNSVVEQRSMEQWFLRITAFADALWRDIDQLSRWSPRAVAVQRNWINKSVGVELDFAVVGLERVLSVYTTRVDTLFGVTALVMAPDHPLADAVLQLSPLPHEQRAAILERVRVFRGRPARERLLSKEKNGVPTGAFAVHPLTGARVPIWIGDYVLAEYGSGAVMSVPAHDSRDHQFALQYGLDVVQVVAPGPDSSATANSSAGAAPEGEAYTEDGVLIASAEFSGLSSAAAREAIATKLTELGRGKRREVFNLRDWSIGRQRYWGCPIPVINCPSCGTVGVAERDLPVLLAEDVDFSTGKAELPPDSPFRKADCPRCGGPAARETDTLDTFMDSSWYAFRFLDPKNTQRPFESALADRWMPIDFYVGGLEHAAQHLIYFRFLTKFFRSIGLISFDEPVDGFFCNGMVTKDGHKMSKSLGNVVSPEQAVARFGADAVRLYSMSDSPAEDDLDWTDGGLHGKADFLSRNYATLSGFLEQHFDAAYAEASLPAFSQQDALYAFYGHLREFESYIERSGFHQAVARLHEMSNVLLRSVRAATAASEKNAASENAPSEHAPSKNAPSKNERRVLCLLIHQFLIAAGLFVPHLAEALLASFYAADASVYHASWPELPQRYLESDQITCIIQVSGKKRGEVKVARGSSEGEVLAAAQNEPGVARQLDGKAIVKTVYVADRLLNIVAR